MRLTIYQKTAEQAENDTFCDKKFSPGIYKHLSLAQNRSTTTALQSCVVTCQKEVI